MLDDHAHSVVYQVQLLSTWGDEFYIGLNGIELFNANDQSINIRLDRECRLTHPDAHTFKSAELAAYPESVNVLRDVHDDPRTSANVVDGVNDTEDARHMWLAPLMHNDVRARAHAPAAHVQINRIFFIFDTPTAVARVRVWNYRKTAARAVRSLSVSDDT
jgi:hypothetical protein